MRAPIPPVRQVLVDDFADMDVPMFGPRTRSQMVPMFNNTFRDFQREARQSHTQTASLRPDTHVYRLQGGNGSSGQQQQRC